MKKIIGILLLASIMLSSISGCATTPPDLSNPEETRIFVDSLGREVEIPMEVTRVAVSGTLAEMMVFAIAPDSLVGLAESFNEDEKEYIGEEYHDLPALGALYGSKGTMNFESLLATDPDIIIDLGEPKGDIIADMDSLQDKTGIPTIHITTYLDTTAEVFRTLGDILNRPEDAELLATYCEETLATTTDMMADIEKKNAIYLVGDDGLNVIAQGSYHSELLSMMLNNVAVVEQPSSSGMGNRIDMEQLMLWDPEHIIFSTDSVYNIVSDDPRWNSLQAIEYGNYYEVPTGPDNWMGFPPSVQRYLGMQWLSELFYEDETQFDLKEQVCEFYNLFYHSDLSDTQYEELMGNSVLKSDANS